MNDSSSPPPADERLSELLVRHRADLIRFVSRHASARLRRFEAPDDLVQGIHVQALRQKERFEYRGDREFFAWLYRIARSYLLDRAAHWYALRRRSVRLVRIAQAESGSLPGFEPPATGTSPSSFANRRDRLVLVSRALSTLPPRDREMIQLSSAGLSIGEIAEKLDLAYDTAARARLRAFERLKKAYEEEFGRSG